MKSIETEDRLKIEFQMLRKELFVGDTLKDSAEYSKVRRYKQILGYLYPNLRESGWINPIKGI